jgi:hypothetical protein
VPVPKVIARPCSAGFDWLSFIKHVSCCSTDTLSFAQGGAGVLCFPGIRRDITPNGGLPFPIGFDLVSGGIAASEFDWDGPPGVSGNSDVDSGLLNGPVATLVWCGPYPPWLEAP